MIYTSPAIPVSLQVVIGGVSASGMMPNCSNVSVRAHTLENSNCTQLFPSLNSRITQAGLAIIIVEK